MIPSRSWWSHGIGADCRFLWPCAGQVCPEQQFVAAACQAAAQSGDHSRRTVVKQTNAAIFLPGAIGNECRSMPSNLTISCQGSDSRRRRMTRTTAGRNCAENGRSAAPLRVAVASLCTGCLRRAVQMAGLKTRPYLRGRTLVLIQNGSPAFRPYGKQTASDRRQEAMCQIGWSARTSEEWVS